MKKYIYCILRGAVNNLWADKPPPKKQKKTKQNPCTTVFNER